MTARILALTTEVRNGLLNRKAALRQTDGSSLLWCVEWGQVAATATEKAVAQSIEEGGKTLDVSAPIRPRLEGPRFLKLVTGP
jgi:hypothetical protein